MKKSILVLTGSPRKGGVLLYIVLEEKARATKNIDMLARQLNNSLENVEAMECILKANFV